MNFGERMKKIRKEKGLSQLEVAAKMNVRQQTVAQYERAENVPKLKTLKKIAEALGVSVGELSGTGTSYADLMKKLNIEPGPLGNILLANTDELSDFEKDLLSSIIMEPLEMGKFSPNDLQMLYNYKSLNEEGQEKARERIHELTEIPRFRKEPPQIPADSTVPDKEETE